MSSRVLARLVDRRARARRNCYVQRVPDLALGAVRTAQESAALRAVAWRRLLVSMSTGGPSVVLEYGTASRSSPTGCCGCSATLGVVARLKVGRTAKSTTDTLLARHRRRRSGRTAARSRARARNAQDVVRLDRPPGQADRPHRATTATSRTPLGSRVVSTARSAYRGFVYSLEVPPARTPSSRPAAWSSTTAFPKDVSALKQLAGNSGYHFQLLTAVIEVNELQKRRVVSKLKKHLGSLVGKRIGLLGLPSSRTPTTCARPRASCSPPACRARARS